MVLWGSYFIFHFTTIHTILHYIAPKRKALFYNKVTNPNFYSKRKTINPVRRDCYLFMTPLPNGRTFLSYKTNRYFAAAFANLGDLQNVLKIKDLLKSDQFSTVESKSLEIDMILGVMWSKLGSRAEYLAVLNP